MLVQVIAQGGHSMSTEQNKATMRAIPEQIFNEGNLDAADRLFATDYIEHVPVLPGLPAGLAGFKVYVTAVRSAFPDLRLIIEDLVAEGDKVVMRATARGTHRGEFMGIPPTGKQISVTEIHICRFADGKVVEHWANSDQLGMLQQLGVVPTSAQMASR
jgi:steroid delta-isomerase-like uncharacterized protein